MVEMEIKVEEGMAMLVDVVIVVAVDIIMVLVVMDLTTIWGNEPLEKLPKAKAL